MGDPRNRARVWVKVLNVMENQRLQIDLGHHCIDQDCQEKRNFLTKQGDSRARAHELMTSRSAQEATRLGTAAGGADKRRGLRLGGAARGPSMVARGTAACGSAAGSAGARLASGGRARRRGEAKARRRGRELGHEEAAARQCGGSG